MFQKKTKAKSQGCATAILALLFCVLPGCMGKEAVKTDIQGIRNDMGQLKSLVDQKADNKVVAEQIGQVSNRINQNTQVAEELSLWRKSVQAETINYGGAGWVVVGTGVMAFIFLGSGLLLVRAFMKRGNMLSMITRAVKNSGKDTVVTVKKNLKRCVHEGYHCDQDRKNIGDFARKRGTFSDG